MGIILGYLCAVCFIFLAGKAISCRCHFTKLDKMMIVILLVGHIATWIIDYVVYQQKLARIEIPISVGDVPFATKSALLS